MNEEMQKQNVREADAFHKQGRMEFLDKQNAELITENYFLRKELRFYKHMFLTQHLKVDSKEADRMVEENDNHPTAGLLRGTFHS